MSQPTPQQMQAVLKYASARLGVSKEELATRVANGGYEGLSSSLSENGKRALQGIVNDPEKAKALLSSPAVQEFLQRFS